MNDVIVDRRVQEARLLLLEAAERLEDPDQADVAAALASASLHQLREVQTTIAPPDPGELPPALGWFG